MPQWQSSSTSSRGRATSQRALWSQRIALWTRGSCQTGTSTARARTAASRTPGGDQCDECGRTLDPKDLLEPRCSICGTAPEFRESRHLFFRLDLFADRLMEWLDSKGFWKPNVLAFTRNFIGSGLRERPITRDINWGGVPREAQGGLRGQEGLCVVRGPDRLHLRREDTVGEEGQA
ncbi:class I tRNA ligase family protein [Thermogymnomonas acidicola]|uniref:class I tRNA ligase family protein n=1 Tax=Thermogymnomonas acidicola TaxID=399579 RepID=UPI0009463F15|nr:class I tRNA ligase family protein [Thermogymnomonas acidicola]